MSSLSLTSPCFPSTQFEPSSDFQSALSIWEARKSLIRITTGSDQLDKCCGGGLESCSITEVFGEFRTGKVSTRPIKAISIRGNQTRPDQTRPDQTKPRADKTKSRSFRSDQISRSRLLRSIRSPNQTIIWRCEQELTLDSELHSTLLVSIFIVISIVCLCTFRLHCIVS